MPDSLQFRPPWWAVALAAAGCAAGALLGNWQSGRAVEKRTAAASVQRVVLKGEFLPQFTVLLDNKLHRGRPGYHVVQPLRIADTGDHVLVNRGWVALKERRELLPDFRTPSGAVTLVLFLAAPWIARVVFSEPALTGPLRHLPGMIPKACWRGNSIVRPAAFHHGGLPLAAPTNLAYNGRQNLPPQRKAAP